MPRKVPHGYQATCLVRLEFRAKFGLREITKSFATSQYGEERAKQKAEDLETIWRKKFGCPRKHYKTFPQTNGTSGYPGISITSGWDKRVNDGEGRRYPYVKASWVDKKRKRKRHRGTGFSIAKHGLKKAILLAIEARLKGIHGKRFVNNLKS